MSDMSSPGMPSRDDVQRRWQQVIDGEVTREEVHAWADAILMDEDTVYPDHWVHSALETLHGFDRAHDPETPWLVHHGPPGRYLVGSEQMSDGLATWMANVRASDVDPIAFRRRMQVSLAQAVWRERWAGASAQGWRLRGDLPDLWVRFHTLPGSKRYAESEAERVEIERRHITLLTGLDDSAPSDSWFVSLPTYVWPESPAGEAPPSEDWTVPLGPPQRWQSYAPDDYDETVRHLWLYEVAAADGSALVPLLGAVADDRIRDVVIGPRSWEWLYHPYDGGADVIAHDSIRAQLMTSHREWLAPGPSGL